ncbi:MAG: U32 family peptidase [Patescibacteria group bacterium]|nr:U32 family peptidase [Patescibacteria group bacterium]
MPKNTIKLELLAPAKDLNSAKMAVLAGADAVYIGGPQFSARSAAGNSWEDIAQVVNFAHQYYAKVYLPVNIIFFDKETASVKETIDKAYEIGVDALMIQDMGIMEMELPPLPIFASTQNHNYDLEQIKFLEKAGFSRVILARECDLARIRKIKRETKIGLEAFVHGALCVSFSGRCYFSQALCGRSANRGKCMQACRLTFSLIDSQGRKLIKDKFLLSLKDLNLFSNLEDLIEAGVNSFKIEGRLKDEVYVGNVVAKYRQELDKIIARSNGKYQRASSGKVSLDFEPDLDRTFNRGYTDYFLHNRQKDIISLDSQKSLGKLMGKVLKVGKDYFTLDRENDLKNADGLCWFDENGDLVGTNINLVKDGKIYPNKFLSLKPGTDIYRNLDTAFERKVVRGVRRAVAVDFTVKDVKKGLGIEAEDEDGNMVDLEFETEKKLAQKSELVEASWRQQFSKLGGTIFYARNLTFNFKEPYFIPLSVLNDWRREVIAKLSELRTENYPKVKVVHQKTDHPYPYRELDYSFNVANSLARKFYERHGARVLENSFEQQNAVKGKKLMTTKHCLRYFLGVCPKDAGRIKADFKEPLFLVHEGKKYRLSFDCAKCLMEIYNHD